MRRAFITGSAGFIGFHLARYLLDRGWRVHGFDALTPYYDPALKAARHALLRDHPGFTATIGRLEDMDALGRAAKAARPDVIIHLAAQAGVRHSLEAPRDYLGTNITGAFNVMEVARACGVDHLLMASTSSVYGANTDMPYAEADRTDHPLSIYAATKKAGEAMSHAWAHLHRIPVTMFRFFTVYGPWGRPDMAYFKFTDAILGGRPIDIYNHGQMRRDFTYVGDLVAGIAGLMDAVPPQVDARAGHAPVPGDTLSPAAPWRVVNIGNSAPLPLLDFIKALEAELGRPAIRNMMDMQKGDVPATWADARLLRALTGFVPRTGVAEGVAEFVRWYLGYYRVEP